jgi:hypothetical protein
MTTYQHGGTVPGPSAVPVRLAERERIVDRYGRVRGMVFRGRIVWFPLWLVARLPRIPGR